MFEAQARRTGLEAAARQAGNQVLYRLAAGKVYDDGWRAVGIERFAMTEDGALDKVIREVSQAVMPRSRAERRIIIDTAVGRVVESASEAYAARFFIVTNNSLGSDAAKYEVVLTLGLDDDRSLGIRVNCLISCNAGYEGEAALALSSGPSPAESLKKAIEDWVRVYTSGRGSEFMNNYPDERERLEEYITALAFSDLGLDIQATVSLGGEDLLETIKLWPMVFPVQVNDHAEEQKLRVKGNLLIDEENKARAIFYGSDGVALEEVVRGGIQEYFARNVSLKQFCTNLHGDSFRDEVIQCLNLKLKPLGRKVECLIFDAIAGEKELTAYLAELQSLICPFKIEVMSPIADDAEPVVFSGDFYITQIDPMGWYRFTSRDYNLEKAREYLEHCLQSELTKHVEKIYSYRDDNVFKEIEATIINLARQCIKSAFGIEIGVINVRRHLTPLEMKEREVRQKKQEAALELQRDGIDVSRRAAQKLIAEIVEMESHRFKERLKRIHNLEQEMLEDIAMGLDEGGIQERMRTIDRARELLFSSIDALGLFKESIIERIWRNLA